MNKNDDLIFDVFSALQKQADIKTELVSAEQQYYQFSVGRTTFNVLFKSNLSMQNIGAAIAETIIFEKEFGQKFIVFTNYITDTVAEKLKAENICYADASGNMFIKTDDTFFLIKGIKRIKTSAKNKSRLFREAGIKLLYCLLNKPKDVNLPYRALAGKAGIALGSVSVVMLGLEAENFLLQTDKAQHLKNLPELLNRWVVAYNTELRPKLFKKQMRFVDNSRYKNWQNLNLSATEHTILWGAEPAAAILTGYLKPGIFTIYTTAAWHELMPVLGLVPDLNGDVEVLQCFFDASDSSQPSQIVSPLLVYADLINTGSSRNIETATIILQNELSYIK